MGYGRLQTIGAHLDRSLAVSQSRRARLIYVLLLVCLFLDIPCYLPFLGLGRQLLTATALGIGSWETARRAPGTFRQITGITLTKARTPFAGSATQVC